MSEMYKGAGAVWTAYAPTIACEEQFSHGLTSAVGAMIPHLGHQGRELAACAAAGAISGLVVAAPVENLVTRAHAAEISLGDALRSSLHRRGLYGILCPYGQTMMVGREVPFSIGVFFLRDHIAQWFHKRLHRDSSLQYWFGELASSMTCAAAVNIPAHPPSVVLAWQQAREVPLLDALHQIHANSGLRGFYKGFVSRSVSVGGTMFVVPIVLSSYGEIFKGMDSSPMVTKLAGLFAGGPVGV
jgi:hypothetical protein